MSGTPKIQLKRAYTPASDEDGWRILVDRLWPRGISKADAHIKDWFKEIAPTDELRKWFGHEVKKWPEFQKKYKQELKDNKAALPALLEAVQKHPVVTFVFAAKDAEHNNAVVLRDVLLTTIKK